MTRGEKQPSILLSVCILLMIAAVLTAGVISKVATIALLVVNIVLVTVVSLLAGYKYHDLEKGMMEGIRHSIDCVIILVFVGVLIAGWILCGTVPMIIYYGLGAITPRMLLPLTFLLCSLLSVCIGTSLGTAGTMGIACVSIGVSMGIPLPIVAGAAISGSILGDKLSPLSDSTILSASVSKVGLYQHVRSMAYTTIPSFAITFLIFYLIGAKYAETAFDPTIIEQVQTTLGELYHFNIWLLLPLVAIVVLSIMKIPAIPTITISAFIGLALAMVFQNADPQVTIGAIYSGVCVNTGIEIVDTMLSKGGITSMLSTVCTSMLALGLGGILNRAGFLHVLVQKIAGRIKSDKALVLASLGCGMVTLSLLAQFYVSVALTGTMFVEVYDKQGLHKSVLSRTLEEANTIMLPLLPWNTSAVYYMGLFGFTTIAFAPYVIFAYVNVGFSVICALCGLFLFRADPKDNRKTDWKWRQAKKEPAVYSRLSEEELA